MIQLARDEVVRVSSSSRIRASLAEVWALIKPPEGALLLDPTVVKAYRVPGTPEGVGEMQGFISHREGAEHAQLIEVVEEIPERLAVVRQVGSNDPSARVRYRLDPDGSGTLLEYEQALTVRGIHARSVPMVRERYELAGDTHLSRVKYILEGDVSPWQGRHC